MDGTLQMSSDLENAEINTNMQLYYSTISEQTNQLHTHKHKQNWQLINEHKNWSIIKNLHMKLALIQTLF